MIGIASKRVLPSFFRLSGSLALASFLLLSPLLAEETGNIEGMVDMTKTKELPNVVVYLKGVKGDFKPPDLPSEMSQRGLQFIPKVLPIMVGTTVNFLNLDPILHDVFSPDACAERLNLGTWPKDIIRSFRFNNRNCRSVLLCNIHPGMEAWVLVFDHPFFTKCMDSGRYRISNIPPGSYEIRAWHKKFKKKGVKIDVEAGKTAKVNLTL